MVISLFFCVIILSFFLCTKDDTEITMEFAASFVRFGHMEIQPTQKIVLSKDRLCIVVNKSSTSSEYVTLRMNPMTFVKTIYTWYEKSSTILFRVPARQFASIESTIDDLEDANTKSGEH